MKTKLTIAVVVVSLLVYALGVLFWGWLFGSSFHLTHFQALAVGYFIVTLLSQVTKTSGK